jgi:Tfp pilus assembly protein PilE
MSKRAVRAKRRVKRESAGLTLVEVAIVLSLIGVFLAVFVPTFAREVHSSKLAEAGEELLELQRRAASYFEATHRVDGESRRYCLPDLAGPTPAEVSEDGQSVDFFAEETPGHATWEALGFQPGEIRFRYSFLPEASGCGLEPSDGEPVLTVRAEGDLDGDGRLSRFERGASIDENQVLTPTRVLVVEDRVE